MPSKSLLVFSLLSIATIFTFCKKETQSQPEGPFFDFLNDTQIIIDTVAQAADTWEYGFAFTPLKSGKVSQFEIKMPATGDYTVSLWDIAGASPVLLRSKSLTESTAHEKTASDVQEVSLNAGNPYGITVLANTFYRITNPGGKSFDFPRTSGNIRIESFHEMINNTNNSEFPVDTNDMRLAPCVNVIFIAD
ncbi:MAG: DUF4082 domain-containing protein [Lewinellaceae bacterium]|nr:DUF4082 domain-containing protein [Saprospiraceae bacterium]MCB9344552.1 DUF4082 domain-containing protein [Lewinellaceae bacterium]